VADAVVAGGVDVAVVRRLGALVHVAAAVAVAREADRAEAVVAVWRVRVAHALGVEAAGVAFARVAGDVCEAKAKWKQLAMGELEKRKEIENRKSKLEQEEKRNSENKKGNRKLVEMGNWWKWEIGIVKSKKNIHIL
jgi:hypothetical protein